MTSDVMLIAGESGGKSTFIGGLIRYSEKKKNLTINDKIDGAEDDYEEEVIEEMFTGHEYPNQTDEGYIGTFEISGKAFTNPGLEISIVDLPGGMQEQIFRDTGRDTGIFTQLQNGNATDQGTVSNEYESRIKSDFESGNPPQSTDDWETTFLNFYYESDTAIFLLNLFETSENDKDLMYDNTAVEQACNDFTDVAVVPIAVDWYDYDPDSYDPGLLTGIAQNILEAGYRDKDLLEHLGARISRGSNREIQKILNTVRTNEEIAFFSVAVPDKGAPTNATGELTPDGNGFAVQGFSQVREWLE